MKKLLLLAILFCGVAWGQVTLTVTTTTVAPRQSTPTLEWTHTTLTVSDTVSRTEYSFVGDYGQTIASNFFAQTNSGRYLRVTRRNYNEQNQIRYPESRRTAYEIYPSGYASNSAGGVSPHFSCYDNTWNHARNIRVINTIDTLYTHFIGNGGQVVTKLVWFVQNDSLKRRISSTPNFNEYVENSFGPFDASLECSDFQNDVAMAYHEISNSIRDVSGLASETMFRTELNRLSDAIPYITPPATSWFRDVATLSAQVSAAISLNTPPVITSGLYTIGNNQIGEEYIFQITATDPDLTDVWARWYVNGRRVNNLSGEFSFQTTYAPSGEAGTYWLRADFRRAGTYTVSFVLEETASLSSEFTFSPVVVAQNAPEPEISCNSQGLMSSQTIQLRLTDSYGDGWGGGYVSLTPRLATGEASATITRTLQTGASITHPIEIPDGIWRSIEVNWVPGEWASECSLEITTLNGGRLWHIPAMPTTASTLTTLTCSQ